MDTSNEKPNDAPLSLGDQEISAERRARIVGHIAMLSETARHVSDKLAFDADTFDIIAVLDQNADDEHPGDQ